MTQTSSASSSAEGVRLRTEVTPRDEAEVRRLAEATGFFRADETEIACELVRDRLAQGPASGYEFVVAESAEGRMLGYASFGEIPCTIGAYDLYWIIVDPALQGRGLGKLLVREVESAVRVLRGRLVYIETSSIPLYAPTHAFYERCGYTLAARLADFYKPGDDKLVYAKSLGH